MKNNQTTTIELSNANSETKMRFNRYQPYEIIRYGNPICFKNTKCVLLQSKVNSWFGWFPVDHLLIKNSFDTQF